MVYSAISLIFVCIITLRIITINQHVQASSMSSPAFPQCNFKAMHAHLTAWADAIMEKPYLTSILLLTQLLKSSESRKTPSICVPVACLCLVSPWQLWGKSCSSAGSRQEEKLALSASPLNFRERGTEGNVGHPSQMVGLTISTEESLQTNRDGI